MIRMLLFGGLAGKVLGVVRELTTAALFGTGAVAAAYRLAQAAFLIPLHGFLSEAFGAGFIPTYARGCAQPTQASRALFAGMHAIVLAVSAAITVLLVVLARRWVGLLAPGFDVQTAQLATQMVEVLALTMPFYALTGLYASAELAAGRAQLTAARASLQSVGLIAGALLAWQTGNAVFIAGGFLAAYVFLAGYGFWATWRSGLRPWPRAGEWLTAKAPLLSVWRSLRLLFLVPLMMQVHFVVERRVASWVSIDTVAALDYARFLTDTAVLLLAMPIGFAGLGTMPNMSETQFRTAALRSLRMLLYVGAPLSVVLALHAEEIVKLIFARGAFNAASVAATTAILQPLAAGLWALLIGYSGAKFLSARNRNFPLIGIYAAGLSCNVVLNILLYPFIGAAALGVAATAYSLVFGIAMLRCLNLLGALRRDLLTISCISLAYVLAWACAPAGLMSSGWLPLLAFACYWCLASVTVPRCREVLHDAWLSLRTA